MTLSPQAAIDPSVPGAALRKSLEKRHVAMISIGGVIGSGLFIGSSAAIATTGPAVVVSYLLAGALVLLVMRMLGELAAAAPDAGSFTEYVRLGLGDVFGCAAGWLYWYFWVMALAVEALAGGSIVHAWTGIPIWPVSFGIVLAMSGVNLLSTRSFGEAEFWLSAIKVASLLLFILLGVGYLGLAASEHRPVSANLVGQGGFAPFGLNSIFVGIATVVFALVGAEITTVAAAEAREPARAIAQLTTTLILRLSLFFVVSMLLIVTIVPWRAITSGSSPFGLALAQMGVPGVAQIMNAIVLIAVLSCLNAGFFVSSRVLFTLSRQGDAPGWLVALNRRGTPARAILVDTAIACLTLIGGILFPQTIFSFLVNVSGVVMLIIYMMVGMAQIRRRRLLGQQAQALSFRVWWYPWSSYVVLVAIAAVLAVMASDPNSRFVVCSGIFISLMVLSAARHHRTGLANRRTSIGVARP